MLPVIAIVGRPNVGKSTLFNRVTRTRNALVGNKPGLTRDRQYGEGEYHGTRYIVVDTGGLSDFGEAVDESVEALMAKQVWQSIREADAILLLVDARAGLTPDDEHIAKLLRKYSKKVYLAVNKIDGLDRDIVIAEFHELGLGYPYPVSAEHGTHINDFIEEILQDIPQSSEVVLERQTEKGIKVAFIGRPNVGKSTLVNRILGEERVIVYDQPGTTRDSIFVPFTRREKNYVLIDTAGVRRKARVDEAIEKFSVIKTLQAIEASNVVVLLVDAQTNLVEQDLWLLGFVIDAGKALVIAVNKWDNLEEEERARIRSELERRLTFVDFAKIHFISALHGSGVGNLFQSVDQAYESASRKLSTPELTRILQAAVANHEPPLVHGRRIKLRYAHAGGRNPPVIVIHGNQLKSVSADYCRYLERFFRKALKLSGTPIRVEFKISTNPYCKS